MENALLFADMSSFSDHLPAQYLSHNRGFFVVCLQCKVSSTSSCTGIETCPDYKKNTGYTQSVFLNRAPLERAGHFSENARLFLKTTKNSPICQPSINTV